MQVNFFGCNYVQRNYVSFFILVKLFSTAVLISSQFELERFLVIDLGKIIMMFDYKENITNIKSANLEVV
jgi:hypothetical protein